MNTAYLKFFPDYKNNKNIIVYGPDYSIDNLDAIIKEILAKEIPFNFSTEIEHIVNVKNGSFIVTLINNDGVTKEPTELPVIDESKRRTVTVTYTGDIPIQSCNDIYYDKEITVNGKSVTLTVEAGDASVLKFVLG